MRYHEKFKLYPLLKELAAEKKVDLVYLDTTYSHPKHDFVPQEEAVEAIASQTQEALSSNSAKTLVMLSCYSIGKEKVLWEASTRTNQLLYVSEKKMRMLKCVQLHDSQENAYQKIVNRCTEDASKSDIHVIPMGLAGEMWPYFRPNYVKCKEYVEKLDKEYDKVVAFLPTGWANASNWNKKNSVSKKEMEMENGKTLQVEIRLISYSEHSAFTELIDFVQFLRPQKVIPTVFSDEADSRRIQDRFRHLIDSTRAKQAFFKSMSQSEKKGPLSSNEPSTVKKNVSTSLMNVKSASPKMFKEADVEIVCVKKPHTQKEEKSTERSNDGNKVQDLVDMGFDRERAKRNLDLHGGDMSAAINALLSTHHDEATQISPSFPTKKQRKSPQITSFFTKKASIQAFVQNQIANQQVPRDANVRLHSAVSPEKTSTKKKTWYPRRIQEDVNYEKLVQSFYLRHILVETKDMAQIALNQYLENTASRDPFGELAETISACAASREEGGKIGWVDIESTQDEAGILPKDVLPQLVPLCPKTGDVHILESKLSGQVHVIRVEELLIKHNANLLPDEDKELRVGSYSGKNSVVSRRKLKGKGVMPQFPTLEKNKKYMIQTNGCQMNVADSERLAGILHHDLNLSPTTKGEEADVVMFNTCSIRDHAEQKLYDMLGPFCARKRNGEELAIVVTGCVAQQEGEELLRRVPEIDVVLGPQYVPFLKNVLESVEWGKQVVATAPMLHMEDNDFSKPMRGGEGVKAFVNVIHGCNEHCTYCVVPATRGMEQSRSMESVLKECLDLANSGYKEITLIGQNIDAYGRDMTPKRNFAELLDYLNSNLPTQTRIRYVTSHPRYFSDKVIDAVANLDKVCECFHMPFQAGDDEVLKRMRRGYTYDSYMRIINKIRERAPDAAICGDVIVGFPGETEEAFQRTLDLMEEVKFDNLNTFAYSPRPNTEAANWEDQIPEDVKSERLQRVQALATKHGLERSQRYVDMVVEVLVEDKNPRNANQVFGRTRQGRQVYFDGDLDELKGDYVDVLVTEARTWSLVGERHQ